MHPYVRPVCAGRTFGPYVRVVRIGLSKVRQIVSKYDKYQLTLITRATRCITTTVLQTKVDAQCDKRATELS